MPSKYLFSHFRRCRMALRFPACSSFPLRYMHKCSTFHLLIATSFKCIVQFAWKLNSALNDFFALFWWFFFNGCWNEGKSSKFVTSNFNVGKCFQCEDNTGCVQWSCNRFSFTFYVCNSFQCTDSNFWRHVNDVCINLKKCVRFIWYAKCWCYISSKNSWKPLRKSNKIMESLQSH